MVEVPFKTYTFVPVAFVQTRLLAVSGFVTTRLVNVPVVAEICEVETTPPTVSPPPIDWLPETVRDEAVVEDSTVSPLTSSRMIDVVASDVVPAKSDGPATYKAVPEAFENTKLFKELFCAVKLVA